MGTLGALTLDKSKRGLLSVNNVILRENRSFLVINKGRIASRLRDSLAALAKVSLVYSVDGGTVQEILDVDDYIQTILIGESLVANRGFNHRDIVRRYRTKPGHIIAGRGIAASGISTHYNGQVKKLIDSRDLAFRATDGITGGSAMKVACIAAFYLEDTASLVKNTDEIIKITHNSIDSRLAALMTVLRFRQIFLEQENTTGHLRHALVEAIDYLGFGGSAFFLELFDKGAALVEHGDDPARLMVSLNEVIGISHVATSVPIAACLWSFRPVDLRAVLSNWSLHDKYEIRAGDVVIKHGEWRYQYHRQHFLALGYTASDSRLLGEEPRSHFDLDTFFSISFSLLACQYGIQDCVREGELDEFTDNLDVLARNLVDLSGKEQDSSGDGQNGGCSFRPF